MAPNAQLIQTLRQTSQPGMMAFTLSESCLIGDRQYGAGEIVQMAVTPADVTNQTEALDSYLGGYSPYGFCADMVSPVVLVNKQAGTRRDLSKQNAFEVVDTKSGAHGAIKQIDVASGTASWKVDPYALATFLPWMSENDAQENWDIRASAGELIRWKLALDREVRVWDSITTEASWGVNNVANLTTNFFWDNGSTKNPRTDLQVRIKNSAQEVNGIYMNPDVAYWMLSDTEFRAYMRQMMGDNAPSPSVAQAAQYGERPIQSFVIPGFPPFYIVPGKKLNLSTDALEYILGDDVVLACTPPMPVRDGHQISTHATFRHRGRSGSGIVTNEYMPQGRGINSGTMFETGFDEESFFVSNIAGGLIKDVLS